MDTIEKIRMIFFEPSVFFKSVRNEKRYLPILMYFAVAYILSSLVSLIFEFRDIKAGASGQFEGMIFGLIAVFMLIFVEIIAYLNPFNLNAPVWADLWNTYTFLWITIAIASAIHIFYIECVGLSMYHKISKIRALVAILLIPIAMLV